MVMSAQPSSPSAAAQANAPVQRNRITGMLGVLFVLSMLVPIFLPVGSLLLMPYRILLLIAIIPLTAMLLSGKAGPVLLIDKMVGFSALWTVLALIVLNGQINRT